MTAVKTPHRNPTQADRSRRGPALLTILVVGFVAAAAATALLLGDRGSSAPATAPVSIDGQALPPLVDPAADPAVGMPMPRLTAQTPAGDEVTLPRESDGPGGGRILAFVAHWCNVCQAEVPKLEELVRSGGLPADVSLIAIATGTDAARGNYPPVSWLEREGWSSPILLDDDAFSAGTAFGLPGYPFFVFVDGQGTVVARFAGALPVDAVAGMAQQLSIIDQ
jgi:thiol-disulfide isomerase/thioredoxin